MRPVILGLQRLLGQLISKNSKGEYLVYTNNGREYTGKNLPNGQLNFKKEE